MRKILNISEALSIAIHSVVLIARSSERMNAEHLSDMTGFSKNHIAKVLQQLVKHRILESERGPKGGFTLLAKPEDVKLMDIYVVIDGTVEQKADCCMLCDMCPLQECVFGGLTEKFTNEFIQHLNNKTIATYLKS